MSEQGTRLVARLSGGLCGAFVGMVYAWLAREQPPTGVAELEGRRVPVMQPIFVAPTPWWEYAALATVGAVMALLAVRAVDLLRSSRQQ